MFYEICFVCILSNTLLLAFALFVLIIWITTKKLNNNDKTSCVNNIYLASLLVLFFIHILIIAFLFWVIYNL